MEYFLQLSKKKVALTDNLCCFKEVIFHNPFIGGLSPLSFLKKIGEIKLLSYTFAHPFDYYPNLSGWALISKKERCLIKCRLYDLMYDLCSSFSDFDDLVITSMWRSESNNFKVGGKPDSKHLNGFAIDVRINEASKKLISTDKYEVIRSKNCIHIQRSAEHIINTIIEGK